MTLREKCQRHDDRIKTFQPIVFCVRCGSTNLDQNSETSLECYDCGNTLEWDANRFSIRRECGGPTDVLEALERLEPGGRGYRQLRAAESPR